MSNILFHIGYHKTGSSFLQKNVFESFPIFNRVNQYEINRNIIYPGPFHFDENKCKKYIENSTKENHINIFSNERLSGGPHSGGRDAKEIAIRIKSLVPNAKILIVFREQFSAIYSSYKQYIRAGGSLSLKEYLRPKSKNDLTSFRIEHFEYHHLVKHYCDLFGTDNVLCIPYELLKKNQRLFLDKIFDFIKLDKKNKYNIYKSLDPNPVNKSFNYLQINLLKMTNPFTSINNRDMGTTFNSRILKFIVSVINKIAKHLISDFQNKKHHDSKIIQIKNLIGENFF